MHHLDIQPRAAQNRGKTRRGRELGRIPAVIYGGKTPAVSVEFELAQFVKIQNKIRPGHLSTARFSLTEQGTSRSALIKEIQYHPVSYAILHIDFELLHDDLSIAVKIPLDFAGVEECSGVKQGGFLRQVIRSVKVRCLPRDIPECFTLDVRDLGIKESRKLREIEFPERVMPLAPLQEVAVVVSKR